MRARANSRNPKPPPKAAAQSRRPKPPAKVAAHAPSAPWWPLLPLLALASLGYVFTQQTALLLRVTLITMTIGGVYWLVVILPQRGKARHLLDAASADDPAASAPAAGTA